MPKIKRDLKNNGLVEITIPAFKVVIDKEDLTDCAEDAIMDSVNSVFNNKTFRSKFNRTVRDIVSDMDLEKEIEKAVTSYVNTIIGGK